MCCQREHWLFGVVVVCIFPIIDKKEKEVLNMEVKNLSPGSECIVVYG